MYIMAFECHRQYAIAVNQQPVIGTCAKAIKKNKCLTKIYVIMRKLEFDGIIGAVTEKTNSIIVRVGSDRSEKTKDGTYETQTEWINCILSLTEKDRYNIGDRYFFRGDLIVDPYISKKEEGVPKAQISVYITEKPVCLYRKSTH